MLGQRKLEVNWCFTEQDQRSMEKTLHLLTQRFEKLGLGTFDFGGDPPSLATMTDAAHQMGQLALIFGLKRAFLI